MNLYGFEDLNFEHGMLGANYSTFDISKLKLSGISNQLAYRLNSKAECCRYFRCNIRKIP